MVPHADLPPFTMKTLLHCGMLWIACLQIAGCADGNHDQPTCVGITAFTGKWHVVETCSGNNYQNEITITEQSGGIIISNLGGGGSNSAVTATVSGNDFTIPPQTVQGIVMSGSGRLHAGCDTLSFIWSGFKGDCSATATK
ncbi:MAG: hypothetical protein KatS3mg031_1436 [Chitinophagales bacterium]|nr:MAG: hypothetical protein KatS3mg031_1436 [Chitinophagales bacterium]